MITPRHCCILLSLLFIAGKVTAASIMGPGVTGTTDHSATIRWVTNGSTDGWVEYAPEEWYLRTGSYADSVPADGDGSVHEVSLENLTPATRYHYRVWVDNTSTPDRSFLTFPKSGPFTFIVYGDTQEQAPLYTQAERHRLVAERAGAEENISFLLHLGDLVCEVQSGEEWARFFDAADPVLSRTSIYPMLGNHEENASIYYDLFGLPEWYAFECGVAQFVVLDSNDWMWPRIEEQTAWLEEELEGTDAQWQFVAFHHPPYSAGMRVPRGRLDLREAWEEIFAEHGVDAVFSGHVHAYERYVMDGIQYIVAGTGGGPPYPLSANRTEGFATAIERTIGYVRVAVGNDSVKMEFMPVALVSEDQTEIVEVYPPGTVGDTVVLNRVVPTEESAGVLYSVVLGGIILALALFVRRKG
ncbi:MAG: metallophosphoesterase family protein [Methanomicrobiaceae archaeon]|nr:metallophosphoesterase family protein [Methanomicrobiaceae archaeon]